MIGLRSALTQHFDATETRTILLRLREAGMLPDGEPGRGHSAAITPTDAAWALLAMISPAPPIATPAAARELAAYKCVAHFLPRIGACHRHAVEDGCLFGQWVEQEIAEAAADPGFRVCGLYVEPNRISTIDQVEIDALDREPGGPAALVDVARLRERLLFEPDRPSPRVDERGRPLSLSFLVKPELIRSVAAAFAAPVTILSAVR